MSFGGKAAQRLANKIVLITGASSGIGEATAGEFAVASNGNIKLILAARREDKLNSIKKELISEFPSIKVLVATLDVSVKDSITSFLNELPEDFADIDILVNNAGKALGGNTVGNLSDGDIEGMINTNLVGLINMTNKVLPIFKAKNRGDIVNIGSVAATETFPNASIYCTTKVGVKYFTGCLRRELVNTRIRVMEVDPGAVLTEFSLVRANGDQSLADKVYEGLDPLGADDIAEIIVFGCSRKLKTVIAETLVFPTQQAGLTLHRGPVGDLSD